VLNFIESIVTLRNLSENSGKNTKVNAPRQNFPEKNTQTKELGEFVANFALINTNKSPLIIE
jgi:hypothetical protein